MNSQCKIFSSSSVLLLVLTTAPTSAIACSCAPLGDGTKFAEEAEVVFIGRVKTVTNWFPSSNLRVQLSVQERLKGPTQKTIEVWTSSIGTACGMDFKAGETYLVYAFGNKSRLETSGCSSFYLNPGLDGVVKQLRVDRDFNAQDKQQRRKTARRETDIVLTPTLP